MEAKELMIGDWVQGFVPDSYSTIYGIFNEGRIAIIAEPSKTYIELSPEDVQPIPLTPEILEKNGFEKLDFSHFQIGDRRLVLDADGRWDGPLSWHWVVTEMDTNAKGQPVVLDYYVATINYVHQLQHALRLCGITKEIQI